MKIDHAFLGGALFLQRFVFLRLIQNRVRSPLYIIRITQWLDCSRSLIHLVSPVAGLAFCVSVDFDDFLGKLFVGLGDLDTVIVLVEADALGSGVFSGLILADCYVVFVDVLEEVFLIPIRSYLLLI